jgi:hypothetical protein
VADEEEFVTIAGDQRVRTVGEPVVADPLGNGSEAWPGDPPRLGEFRDVLVGGLEVVVSPFGLLVGLVGEIPQVV